MRFELFTEQKEVEAGSRFAVILRAQLRTGWHLYSMDLEEGGPIPTAIKLGESPIFTPAGEPREPDPIPFFDPNFDMETSYHEGEVDFVIPVQARPSAPAGFHDLEATIRYMLCTDTTCLPPQTKSLTATVSVSEASSPPVQSDIDRAPTAPSTSRTTGSSEVEPPPGADEVPPEASAGSATGSLSTTDSPNSVRTDAQTPYSSGLPQGWLAYILGAMGMGGLALLTPCVFPMIPVTVSYFTKREAATRGTAIFEAAVYSLGIILTFTILAFALTLLLGAGGINRLAANPAINVLIAGIFIVFALSLFGVFELALPNSWLNAINRRSTQATGVTGILLMALTFSLTSFTCTVPFVGTVMVAALQGDLLRPVVGVTAFAFIFSLPFFLLAVFPSWLQSLPRSGNWMNSVKIVMGFLELAAAVKFISNVDLVYQWELITRPVFITVWLAIGIVLVMYLLGWFRFPHEAPLETVGAGRVLFSIFFLAVSFYLLRGLFGFPLGEMDAFLPPRDYGNAGHISLTSSGRPGSDSEPIWMEDYGAALARAREENRPLFIDFTGVTCTNCRWMESNIFPRPEVQDLFQQYILVRLYTDRGTPQDEANQAMERERFGTIALPFYAVMSPQDEVLVTFPA